MTVSTTNTVAGAFDGNDVTTSFPFTDIKVLQKADFRVFHTDAVGVETELVLDTDYLLVLNADQDVAPGGTITYPKSGSPLPTGEQITGQRIVAQTQLMDLANQSKYDAEVVELSADNSMMILQQLHEELERAIRLPLSESGTDIVIPGVADRALKLLGFNAAGEPISASAISSALVTTFMETLLDDDTATEALATLGLVVSTFTKTLLDATDADTFWATLDTALTKLTLSKTFTQKLGADVASASSLSLGAGNFFDVTGTVTITSIATSGIGTYITLQFDAALKLTHHATDLILPGAKDITTAAGDIGVFYEHAAGDWRCVSYTKAINPSILNAGLNTKLIDIGDWNMDADPNVIIAHGLTWENIRSVEAFIRVDLGSGSVLNTISYHNASSVPNGKVNIEAANVIVSRVTGGDFDSAAYSDTSYNRGWITIQYVD